MSQLLELDSYVHHETGDWKVSSNAELVKVWRVTDEGTVEEREFPGETLSQIEPNESSWQDPSEL